MNIKRSLVALFALVVVIVLAFIPKEDGPLEKLIASLEKWADTNPQEKVYLHTDRPYYLVGDTIWFKAYVTIGSKHQLSALSGAVYVDLINESDSLAQSIKLPLMAGMAKGEFVLSDSTMRDGNYRIRAYTQWMRNAGPDYFYDKIFKVGNSITDPVFSSIKYEYTKTGSGTTTTAVIIYTNDKGEPYANKEVNYDLVENSNGVLSGKKQTDAKGELRIEIKPDKTGKFTNSQLITKIEIANKEIFRKSFLIKSVSTQSEVQFFPESGPLVNGIRARVAFKAIGTSGNGINVKGVITNNNNAQVAEFESSHLGMGYFQLTPETGKSYQAKITYADGSENTVKLPDATDNGYNLAVYNNSEADTILVRIRAGEATLKGGEPHVGLIAQSSGAVYFGSDIAVNKPMITIPIPAKDFPSGIMQFTLFSSTGEALNERIVFIQRNDQMDLQLNTTKKTYGLREKVEVDLDAKDLKGQPVTGNFSVSVVNENAVPVDEVKENTIFSQILLSSDIKGYIENPNYYFTNPSEETKANLDILMLTQGYRRFVWKDLLSGKSYTPAVKAEKMTTEITGKLFNLGNKPLEGGKVILMSNKLGLVGDTITDAQGNFKFGNLLITTGVGFTVQGRTAKGGNKVELKLDMPSSQLATPNPNIGDLETDLGKTMAAVLDNSKKQEEAVLKRGMLGRTMQLKEVQIKARKRWSTGSYSFTIPEGHADRTVKPDANDQFKDVLEFLTMRLSGIIFKSDDTGECGTLMLPYYRNERMQIILNGTKLKPCENLALYETNPSDIIKVDVVSTNQALISTLGGPSLVITTKFGGYRISNDFSLKNYSPQGFSNSKEFYSPKYKKDGNDPQLSDLRNTIYWNPSIITAGGKAKFDFFTADSQGTYRVVVEGMNADGLLGRKVYRYEVK